MAIEKATFGAGCFWGVEARFAEMPGVLDTAEVVEVKFDPSRLAYEALLDAFFAMHDPTQVNRQGPDFGTQYRSVVFAHSDEQACQAREKIAELNATGAYRKPIATQVEPARAFWRAEEYHQRYLEKRGMVHCHI